MTTPHAQAHLIQNTGIGQGQYMWWENKEACDKWFLAHSKDTIKIENYSRIYGESVSRNKVNVGAVNVNASLDESMDCDYFSYYNDDAARWFHAAITNREFVSDKATRLHFAIDYVATYFDKLKFKQCYIQRMTGEEAPYTNNISEPFSPNIIETPNAEMVIDSVPAFLDGINTAFKLVSFTLNSDMSADQYDVNNPDVKFVGGFPYGGYTYPDLTLGQVKDKVSGIIKKTRQYIAKTLSTASTVQSIVCAPQQANRITQTPTVDQASCTIPQKGKWHKTWNCQYMKIVSASGAEMVLKPLNFGTATIPLQVVWYGGLDGCARIRVAFNKASYNIYVDSPIWGQMGFAGTGASQQTIAGMTGGDIVNKLKSVIGM